MSAFEVEFTRNASTDFDDAVNWYGERSIEVADRLIEEIEKALDALEQTPHRFPPARESAKLGVPLRELAIGAGKRLTHRMVFIVRPAKVVVYAIRHTSRRDLTLDDLIS